MPWYTCTYLNSAAKGDRDGKRTLLLDLTRVLSGVGIKKIVLVGEEPPPLALLTKKAVNRREGDSATTTTRSSCRYLGLVVALNSPREVLVARVDEEKTGWIEWKKRCEKSKEL